MPKNVTNGGRDPFAPRNETKGTFVGIYWRIISLSLSRGIGIHPIAGTLGGQHSLGFLVRVRFRGFRQQLHAARPYLGQVRLADEAVLWLSACNPRHIGSGSKMG